MDVGPYSVAVTEVPGVSLTAEEWRNIALARLSYATLWGGPPDFSEMPVDPLDGHGPASLVYDARHYLARVRDAGLGSVKLVTARVVALRPGVRAEWPHDPRSLQPYDLRFWQVRTDGRLEPLWRQLESVAQRLAPGDDLARFRIACVGRLAAFPAGQRDRVSRLRERTAVAWAAIQVLAATDDPSLLYVLTIRPELASRVLTIGGLGMAFTPTEETLGLPPGSVTLDEVAVRHHRLGWPGYWVHSGDAADALAELLEQGLVTIADLGPAMARLTKREPDDLGTALDRRNLAALLTRPRLFKCLIPLLRGDEPLSLLSCSELQARLLFETRSAPYSCTVPPGRWAASARALLEAADRRHSKEVATR